MARDKKYWRTNHQIRGPQVRVVGEEGQIGVMPVQKAQSLAREKGLDLIEIAPRANPPVVKIADFGKFRYQEEKKARKSKTKSPDLKEVRFTPFIGDADYQTRLTKVKEFLTGGDKVKVVVKFKGRQMQAKRFGYELTDRLLADLEQETNIDSPPKFVGRHLVMVISPTSKTTKKEEKNGKKTKDKQSLT